MLDGFKASPFASGPNYNRCLWISFIGAMGVWHQATLPIDDSVDPSASGGLIGLCELVGKIVNSPMRCEYQKALVVLRSPTPAGIGEADEFIFRLVSKACAGGVIPWTFHVVEPDGIWEITGDDAPTC